MGKTFGQIKTETVDPVFSQPKLEDFFDKLLSGDTFVIEVVAHVKIVFGRDVQPGVVGSGAGIGVVPVELRQRALAKSVVEHHIQNHRNAPCMAGIHKFFEFFGGAVIFVQGHVVRGVVAPGNVAFKLVDRHQLDGIDTQTLEIIQGIDQTLVIMAGGKVAQEQLVDHQFFPLGALEIVNFPGISRFAGLHHRNNTRGFPGRVCRQIREGLCADETVIVWVEHQRTIRVADAAGTVYHVLKAVGFARFDVG